MNRREIIVRSALPFGGLNLLLWWVAERDVPWVWLGLFPCLLCCLTAWIGHRAAERDKLSWPEVQWAFLAGMIPLLFLEPALILLVLMYGGGGLLLLPLVSKAVRQDETVALPCQKVCAAAAIVLAALFVLVGRYVDIPDAAMMLFLINFFTFPFTAAIALALGLSGQVRAGAWVGTVASLCRWTTATLLWFFLGQ